MTDGFINISDLKDKTNFVNQHFDNHNVKSVYQIQGIDMTSKAMIIEVGKFENVHDIIINRFNLSPNQTCILSSCLFFDKDILNNNSIPSIKIIINYSKNNILKPVACIILSFISEKYITKELLSSKDNIIHINGNYVISFHFKEKKIVLEDNNKFIGTNKFIDKMINHLISNEVQHIVDDLFKICDL